MKRHQPYAAIGIRAAASPEGWEPWSRPSGPTPATALVVHPLARMHACWVFAVMVPKSLPSMTSTREPLAVLPDARPAWTQVYFTEEASDTDVNTLRKLSADHGLPPPLSRPAFLKLLRKICYKDRSAFVSFEDPGTILGPLTMLPTTAARDPGRGGVSAIVHTVPGEPTTKKKLCRDGEIEDDDGPRIVFQARDKLRSLVAFKPTRGKPSPNEPKPRDKKKTRGDGWRGVFVSLRNLADSQQGSDPEALQQACARLRVELVAGDDPLETAENELLACCRLYAALLAEHVRRCPDLPPSADMSRGIYAKALYRQAGLAAPFKRFTNLDLASVSPWMGATFAGEVGVSIRATKLPSAYYDFDGAFAIAAMLTSQWDVLAADTCTIDQVAPEEAVAELARLAQVFTAYLGGGDAPDPGDWQSAARLLVYIKPSGDRLPHRVEDAPRWWMQRGPLTYRRGALPYSALDVLILLLEGGEMPHIVDAEVLRPEGRAAMSPVRLPSGRWVDPTREDVIRELWLDRCRADLDVTRPRVERDLERGAGKAVLTSVISGLPLQVNDDEPTKEPREMLAFDPRTREPERHDCFRIEKPGEHFFPPVACAVNAAARLMLHLGIELTHRLAGNVSYVDTDSILIVASQTGGQLSLGGGAQRLADGTPAVDVVPATSAEEVRWEIDRLLDVPEEARPWVDVFDSDGNWVRLRTPRLLKREPENRCGPSGFRTQLFAAVRAAKKHHLYWTDWSGDHVELIDGKPQVIPPSDSEASRPANLGVVRPSLHNLEISIEMHQVIAGFEHLLRLEWGMPTVPPDVWFEPWIMVQRAAHIEILDRFPDLLPYQLVAIARISALGQIIAPWDEDFDPSIATWRDMQGRRLNPYDAVAPLDLETVGDRQRRVWRAFDGRLLDAQGTPCSAAMEGPVAYGPTRATRLVHLGKESRRLGVGRGSLFESDVATYGGDDPMLNVRAAGLRLCRDSAKRVHLEEATHLSENGLRYFLSGQRTNNWPDTQAAVIRGIALLAREELRRVDAFGPLPRNDLDAVDAFLERVPEPERRCQNCGRGLIGRQQLWCSDACRKEFSRQPEMPWIPTDE